MKINTNSISSKKQWLPLRLMRKSALLFLFALVINVSLAQVPAITGWVYNKETLETIPGAVVVDQGNNQNTQTNNNGYYQLPTTRGDKTIIVAATGFKPVTLKVEVEASVSKNVFLIPVDFDELDSAEDVLSLYNQKMSVYSPRKKQITEAPSVLSVIDPVKYLQFLPSVTGGIEGLSGLVVRGSNPDQNLIMMNGMPIYGNGHMWGFLSNFNPEIVKNADFYRGVAPAHYGGRAGGGVLDVQTEGGSAIEWTGKMNADLITANITANGPLDHRGKVTSSIGIRRSYLDWLIGAGSGDAPLVGNVHDLNARVDYKESQKTQWNFWIYNGRDKYGLNSKISDVDSLGRLIDISLKLLTSWQNTLAGVRWSHEFHSNLFGSLSVGLSKYKYLNQLGLTGSITTDTSKRSAEVLEKFSNTISDIHVNGDFNYIYSHQITINYGSQFIVHALKPGKTYVFNKENNNAPTIEEYGLSNMQNVVEWANYAEVDMHPNIGLSLNMGMRLWSFFTKEKSWIRPEPRIIISQLLEGKKRIQFGLSVANQGLHQLSSVNGILPGDIWFPSGTAITPQRTSQISAAYMQPLFAGTELSGELYYKSFKGITDLTGIEEDPLLPNYWERSITQGVGSSYGFELLLSKKTGIVTGVASYSYSKTQRKFEYINENQWFPYRWDRPHQFKMQMTINASSAFKINFAAVVMSGNVNTVPTGKYIAANGRMVYDYTVKNNYRMPMYKRIDIGFTKQIKPFMRRGYDEFYGIQIYNVLNWNNPLFTQFKVTSNNQVNLVGLSYFNFIPSAFYRIEF